MAYFLFEPRAASGGGRVIDRFYRIGEKAPTRKKCQYWIRKQNLIEGKDLYTGSFNCMSRHLDRAGRRKVGIDCSTKKDELICPEVPTMPTSHCYSSAFRRGVSCLLHKGKSMIELSHKRSLP